MSSWKTAKLKKLADAFCRINEQDDMLNFLRDLCTAEELRDMAGRWEVVALLDQGIPYREIANKTGVSTATITRIAHWLNNGEGGYKKALREK